MANVNYASYDTENLQSNIVKMDTLKNIQGSVLRDLKNAIIPSMGPAGSNTLILRGMENTLLTEYSKDGNKIIKNISYSNPIEMSIQTQIEDITRYIERKVGDGTSSAVVLSSIIFDKLTELIKDDQNPYQTVRDFQEAVKCIQTQIKENTRECTLDDIYNISLISTNGNEDLAEQMMAIYKEHGMNVFIDVSSSLDEDSYTASYNGLSLETGYSDNVFINTTDGVSKLSDPRIYAFQDPIDTPEMVALFESIINNNIFSHMADPSNMIPTVILCPRFSRDMSGLMRVIINHMKRFSNEMITQKPPLLVVTNIGPGVEVNHYANIAQLCGCTLIGKYIDPKLQKKDQDAGRTPTIENVTEGFVNLETGEITPFYGTASLVESDALITKFNNPDKMYKKKDDGEIETDENGNPIFGSEYTGLIAYLEAEIKRAQSGASDIAFLGGLKRQLNCLKANMVEFFVGGVSNADRDSLKDLVEDAVLNCRSAAKYGVGYGANWEGLHASDELGKMIHFAEDPLQKYYLMISDAYKEISRIIYSTTISDSKKVEEIILESLNKGPYNISTGEFDEKVLTSIMSDITILDTISKIITIMFTSNQALVPSPHSNMYR